MRGKKADAMSMTNHHNRKNDGFILYSIEELVPQDHLVRKLERAVDWTFIYPLAEDSYSRNGRPGIDPVILYKMVFLNFLFGNNSMRKTCKEIQVNLAYRWFLGLSMEDPVPDYSTWSQNYIRRYGNSEVFDQIFQRILKEAMDHGFLNPESVFGDSTHQKASANKRKAQEKEVEILRKRYDDALLQEINQSREEHGQKKIGSVARTELNYDEETGELLEQKKTRKIQVSTTDPESGIFHKGEKEKCFAYSQQCFCDPHGYVLAVSTVPGNVSDSQSFFEAYDQLKKYRGIRNVVLDSGYNTPAICREIVEDGKKPYLPYKRPMTKEGYLRKQEFVYDEKYDYYLCPNDQELSYSTTNREGYKEYKSDPALCRNCPFRKRCTQSASHQKVITRHVWEEYKESAEEIRGQLGFRDIYGQRKETIERVFADCKEKHGLRYTRLRGLKKNHHQALIIFACHNLEKLAVWKDRWKDNTSFSPFSLFLCEFFPFFTS